MNVNRSVKFFFVFVKNNKYFLFNLNKYICEYDYEYFRFCIHSPSALLLAKTYLSASGIYSVPIERIYIFLQSWFTYKPS